MSSQEESVGEQMEQAYLEEKAWKSDIEKPFSTIAAKASTLIPNAARLPYYERTVGRDTPEKMRYFWADARYEDPDKQILLTGWHAVYFRYVWQHDQRPWWSRWFYRLSTPVEQIRALVCFTVFSEFMRQYKQVFVTPASLSYDDELKAEVLRDLSQIEEDTDDLTAAIQAATTIASRRNEAYRAERQRLVEGLLTTAVMNEWSREHPGQVGGALPQGRGGVAVVWNFLEQAARISLFSRFYRAFSRIVQAFRTKNVAARLKQRFEGMPLEGFAFKCIQPDLFYLNPPYERYYETWGPSLDPNDLPAHLPKVKAALTARREQAETRRMEAEARARYDAMKEEEEEESTRGWEGMRARYEAVLREREAAEARRCEEECRRRDEEMRYREREAYARAAAAPRPVDYSIAADYKVLGLDAERSYSLKEIRKHAVQRIRSTHPDSLTRQSITDEAKLRRAAEATQRLTAARDRLVTAIEKGEFDPGAVAARASVPAAEEWRSGYAAEKKRATGSPYYYSPAPSSACAAASGGGAAAAAAAAAEKPEAAGGGAAESEFSVTPTKRAASPALGSTLRKPFLSRVAGRSSPLCRSPEKTTASVAEEDLEVPSDSSAENRGRMFRTCSV